MTETLRSAGDSGRIRLVIVGSGFGGFSLARNLRGGRFDVTLVTPRNYFLFTPLLPSAVSGSVEARSILEPLRRRLRGRARVVEALAVGVDWQERRLLCRDAVEGREFDLPWDRLVLAVGAEAADYGVAGVARHALLLRSIEDALRIRRKVLEQLASAGIPGRSREEIDQALTFVVCGGGPTGVEVAAELHDLLVDDARVSYPELAPRARVLLLEASDRLLSGFDQALAEYTRKHFLRSGVEVRMSSPAARVEPEAVILRDGTRVPCGLVVWAGGNVPVDLVSRLGLPRNERGSIVVDDHLRVAGWPGVRALGDCAAFGDPALPATAQVAQQQGSYLARALLDEAQGKEAKPFEYKRLGMLAYIGAGRALADLPGVKWSGRGAWIFWRSVYVTKLVSVSNKFKVLFDWVKATLFGRDLSRF